MILIFDLFITILIISVYIFNHIETGYISNLLAFLMGYVYADIWGLISCKYMKLDGRQFIKGKHYHHSLFGILGVLLAIIYLFLNSDVSLLLIFWSFGVIFQDALEDGKINFITSK